MKTIPLIVALIFAAGFTARGQVAEEKRDARQELLKLEHRWGDAIVKRDATEVDRILADDYLLTTPWGQRVTKEQALENIRSSKDPSFEVKGVDQGEIQVRLYGEAAVVTSRFTLKAKAGGRDVQTPFRHTDVFIKRDGRWQCVTRQATRIVEPAGPAAENVSGRSGSGVDAPSRPNS